MILVLRRTSQTAITLFVLITATFFLLRALPGGPFDSDNALPPEVKASLEARYHLKDPLSVQYWHYLKNLSRGDLGTSYQYAGLNVPQIIRESLPVTLRLGALALGLAIAAGIPLGIVAARYRHSKWDFVVRLWASGGISLPDFLVAPILIIVFSFWLDWLPPALLQGPSSYILPAVTLALRPAALIARLVRAAALDSVSSEYVRTARAKGLGETAVYFKHVLRNSLVPVLGIAGPLAAGVLSGSFIVEMMFAIPGLGRYYIESVSDRDYPLVMSLTILYAIVLSLATLAADLLSAAADPRMRNS